MNKKTFKTESIGPKGPKPLYNGASRKSHTNRPKWMTGMKQDTGKNDATGDNQKKCSSHNTSRILSL